LEFVHQLATRRPTPLVYASVRNPAAATELNNFAKTHQNVKVLKADLIDAESLVSVAQTIGQQVGHVDILIVNGGQWKSGRVLENIDADILAAVEVNGLGPIRALRAFLPLIRKGHTKKVAIVSSAAGSVGLNSPEIFGAIATHQVPYNISKGFLNGLAHQAAADLHPEGIIVVPIHPGLVKTEMSTEATSFKPEVTASFVAKNPNAFTILTPEESVKHQLNVIDNLTLENSGKFVDHLNASIPW